MASSCLLLAITRSQVQQAAQRYFGRDQAPHGVAVIAGPGQLQAANRKLGGQALAVKRI